MGKRKSDRTVDRHALYEAAVQCVEADVEFIEKIYKKKSGNRPRDLREDFCGTASLATEWVRRGGERSAWGVDLDGETIDWGRKHRVASLGDDADRVTLVQADVREVLSPRVDAVAAFNFSYCVLKKRADLVAYFRAVRRSLRPGGLFFLDLMGGFETMTTLSEKTRKPGGQQLDGRSVPAFTYIWEQAQFNPIDNHLVCHIHFKLRGGRKIKRAFTYDWRLWTLPEIRDAMDDAGFPWSEVYTDKWDDDLGESDGVYRRRKRFDNQDAWVAYVVAGA